VSRSISVKQKWPETLLYTLKDRYRVLEHLSRELSQPIDPKAADIDYLPTQYLTELIRNEGYDGVVYKSAMYPGGRNLVLFSPDKAKAMNVEYVVIKNINYQTVKVLTGSLPFPDA
jgi:hypothetical protein